jgi:hypothetical protein
MDLKRFARIPGFPIESAGFFLAVSDYRIDNSLNSEAKFD